MFPHPCFWPRERLVLYIPTADAPHTYVRTDCNETSCGPQDTYHLWPRGFFIPRFVFGEEGWYVTDAAQNTAAATCCTSVSQLCEQLKSRVSGSGEHQIAPNSANVDVYEHRRNAACPLFESGLGRSNRFRLSDQDNSNTLSCLSPQT